MSKTPLVFFHGNGFPAKSYQQLFNELDEYEISYIETIGLGRYPVNINWTNPVQEIIDYLKENFDRPVKVVGHSFGGVLTVFAASQRPDLFEKAVVIDPPLFGIHKRYIIGSLRAFNQEHRIFKLPTLARLRKDRFESKEAAKNYFKKKPFFKNFDDKALDDYVEHGLKETDAGGVELVIPKRVEEQIFKYMPCFLPSERLSLENLTFYTARKKPLHDNLDLFWLKRMLAGAKIEHFSGTHMIPFEEPRKCAEMIKSQLNS